MTYEIAPLIRVKCTFRDEHKVRGTRLFVHALQTLCHTNGHFAMPLSAGRKAVLTCNTLFFDDHGKFFESITDDLLNSLNRVLWYLADNNFVFSGHVYTVTNLKVSSFIDPNSVNVKNRID